MYEKKFWGTGSAEGMPNPMCNCPTCRAARKIRGKNVRSRSIFRLSQDILVDFGPDVVSQAQKYGGDLTDLAHILITHTHYDHLSAFALCQLAGVKQFRETPVTIYFTEDAFKMKEQLCNDKLLLNNGFREVLDKKQINFEQLFFFQEKKIGNYNVVPLPGRHPGSIEKKSANFLFKDSMGKISYYAVDTGYYYPETIDYLKDFTLSALITECTWGENMEGEDAKHLTLHSLKKLLEELDKQGTLNVFSKVYLTHISHGHTMLHEEIEAYVNSWRFPFEIRVAYDGLEIET